MRDIKVFKTALDEELSADKDFSELLEVYKEAKSSMSQKKLEILSESGDYEEFVELKKQLRVVNEMINEYSVRLWEENGGITLNIGNETIVPKIQIQFTSKQLQLF